MSDKTRKHDLEELYELRKHSKNGFERDMYDRTINTIMRESGATAAVREKLVMAIRNNDLRAIKYFNQELDRIRAHETNGHAMR